VISFLVRSNRYKIKVKSNEVNEMNLDFLNRLNASVLLDSPSKYDKDWRKNKLQVIDWVLPPADSIKSGRKYTKGLFGTDKGKSHN
jgi:hypothetical protein